MSSPAVLATEIARYGGLAEELKARFADLDEETLEDTLEGLSELPDLLKAILRSSLLDEALACGLKARLSEMKERLDRLAERSTRKRELVCESMVRSGLNKLLAEDFAASLRQGLPKLEVCDEAKITEPYLIPQPPRLDRAGLLVALKRGEAIEGASLTEGQPHLQVRTK
jgi:predicted DNA-binding protein